MVFKKLGFVVQTHNLNTQEAEACDLPLFQGQLGLHSEFRACQRYMARPCLERERKKKKKTLLTWEYLSKLQSSIYTFRKER